MSPIEARSTAAPLLSPPMYTRPDWVRRINAMGESLGDARQLVALDADGIVDAAMQATGLNDFGGTEWEEPFRKLLAAFDNEAQLHTVGRLMCRNDALRHLRTRLLVIDAAKRNPAIADEDIVAPLIVTGPARSGTSILQELLAQDPQLRAPFAWEMAYPTLAADDARALAWAEPEFNLWSDVQPEFAAIHELDARLPEECLWLLAPEFDMGFWATCVNVPSWFGYRAGTDATPAYRFHRLMLQTLQHRAAPELRSATWALKSPVHLGRLATLFAVYPDARVIHTHRDPTKTVVSSASTLYVSRFVRSDAIEAKPTGAMVGFGLQMMLEGVIAARGSGALPDNQIADLHYLDLLHRPVEALHEVYDKLSLPWSDALPDRIRGYLAARPQTKFGTHRYTADQFGIDLDQVRAQFAPYLAHYGIASEG